MLQITKQTIIHIALTLFEDKLATRAENYLAELDIHVCIMLALFLYILYTK